MSSLPSSAKDLAQAQLRGIPVAPTQMARVTAQASALSTLIRRTGTVAEERALLCDSLHAQGIDTLEYLLTVRNHPERTVLMLPHQSAATGA
jgi:hypothetical protein